MGLAQILENSKFEEIIRSGNIAVVHFFAPWAAQCEAMDTVLEELEKQNGNQNVKFAKCEAEKLSEIALKYKVEAVPTIVLFKDGKEVERVNGANAVDLTTKLLQLIGSNSSDQSVETLSINDRLKALVNKSAVMVFMKGNPQQPRCGFSRTLVAILNETSVPYQTFDILEDEEVRQGLKTYSNWPTYPQIYVKGELIGGLDIIQELKSAGELVETLKGSS